MSGTSFVDALEGALARLGQAFARATRFAAGERYNWYDNMSVLVGSGTSTDEALREVAAVNRRLGRRAAAAYESILLEYRKGTGIHDAAAQWVPSNERLLLGSVDATGQPDGYKAAAYLLEGLRAMRSTAVIAAIYPTLLLTMAFVVITQIGDKLIPMAMESPGYRTLTSDMQAYARTVLFLGEHQVALFAGLGALVLAIMLALPRWHGRVRTLADKYLPPFILYRYYCASVLVLSLGALVKARLPLDHSLRMLSQNAPPFLRRHVDQILMTYRDGQNEDRAFDTGLLPPSLLVRINALTRAGGLGPALIKAGEGIVDFTKRAIATTAGLLTFGVLAVIGMFIAFTMTFMNAVGSAAANMNNAVP